MNDKSYNKPPPPTLSNNQAMHQKMDRILEKQAYLEGCLKTIGDSMYRVMDKIMDLKQEMINKK